MYFFEYNVCGLSTVSHPYDRPVSFAEKLTGPGFATGAGTDDGVILRQKTAQKSRHDPAAILAEGVLAAAQAPVVEQRPLAEGIELDHLTDAGLGAELSVCLAFGDDPAQQLIIDAVVVQKVFCPVCRQLGGVKARQQIQGNTVFDHAKQLAVQKEKLVHGRHLRIQNFSEFLVFFIKQRT